MILVESIITRNLSESQIAQHLAFKFLAQKAAGFWLVLAVRITEGDHLFTKSRMVQSTGIDQNYFATWLGVTFNKFRQQYNMFTLIQDIRAHNNIKFP